MIGTDLTNSTQREPMVIWGLLTGLFLLQGLYYVYLVSLPGGGRFYWDLDKWFGLATFGFPLAALCGSILALKFKARLSANSACGIAVVIGSLGLAFLLVGIYAVYTLQPETEGTGSRVISLIGCIGLPVGVSLLVWRYCNRRDVLTNSLAQRLPFLICISAHVLQFVLMPLWPFGEGFRFGGASLALLYSAVNFSKMRTTV